MIFLKGTTFSDFIEIRVSNYKHYPNPLSALLEDFFFSIRFKPDQVVLVVFGLGNFFRILAILENRVAQDNFGLFQVQMGF